MPKQPKFDLASVLADVSNLDTREQIQYINLNQLDEDERNFYSLSGLDGLVDSIQMFGIMDPIRVRQHPDADGRYIVISGHRRRAAAMQLRDTGDQRFAEVPCIIQQNNGSTELQELRLIHANSAARVMTAPEIAKQAERVTALLYALQEQGMEFEGRMRDHVAEAVNVSKTKLARLQVITRHLDPCWKKSFEKGTIVEATAYALARMPAEYQQEIFRKNSHGMEVCNIQEMVVTRLAEKFDGINKIRCDDGSACSNAERMMRLSSAADDRWLTTCYCCCKDCGKFLSCSSACKKCAELKRERRDVAKAAEARSAAAQAERDGPDVELMAGLFRNLGSLRNKAGLSIEDMLHAFKVRADGYAVSMQETMERGEKITASSYFPVAWLGCRQIREIYVAADCLGCSIDELLGYTPKSSAGASARWRTGTPDRYGEVICAIRIDGLNKTCYGVMLWDGEKWSHSGYPMDSNIETVIAWTNKPEV